MSGLISFNCLSNFISVNQRFNSYFKIFCMIFNNFLPRFLSTLLFSLLLAFGHFVSVLILLIYCYRCILNIKLKTPMDIQRFSFIYIPFNCSYCVRSFQISSQQHRATLNETREFFFLFENLVFHHINSSQ